MKWVPSEADVGNNFFATFGGILCLVGDVPVIASLQPKATFSATMETALNSCALPSTVHSHRASTFNAFAKGMLVFQALWFHRIRSHALGLSLLRKFCRMPLAELHFVYLVSDYNTQSAIGCIIAEIMGHQSKGNRRRSCFIDDREQSQLMLSITTLEKTKFSWKEYTHRRKSSKSENTMQNVRRQEGADRESMAFFVVRNRLLVSSKLDSVDTKKFFDQLANQFKTVKEDAYRLRLHLVAFVGRRLQRAHEVIVDECEKSRR